MNDEYQAAPPFEPTFKTEKARIEIDVSVARFQIDYLDVERAVATHVRNSLSSEQLGRLNRISLEPIITDDRFDGYDVIVTLSGSFTK